MVKFVEIEAADGGHYLVAPSSVCYLRPRPEDKVAIVFGGFAGGLHELVVAGPVAAVRAQLEAGAFKDQLASTFAPIGATPLATPAKPPPGASRSRGRRAGS